MYQSFYTLVADALLRLGAWLSVIRTGSESDLVTPLIGKTTIDKVTARNNLAAEVWRECRLDSLPLWLREREAACRADHGSYSNHAPYEQGLREGVDRFFVKVEIRIDRHAARVADAFVASRVTKRSLHLRTLDEAASSFEGGTSYGWPFVSSKTEHHESALQLSREVLEVNDPEAYLDFPAILGTRGQAAGLTKRPKSRVVWQCSRVIGNIEKMAFMPIFSALQHTPGFAAWTSAMEVGHAITSMFDGDRRGRRPGAWSPVMSVDFSKFDVTLPHEVINRVYSIIREWFTEDASDVLSNLNHYMTHLSLVTPDGVRTRKQRGMPSGSVMTNLVDSLCNLWVMAYAAARLGARVAAAEVQGDDGVYVFSNDIDPVELQAVLLEDLGMVISPDKGLIAANEVHFLQNVHRRSFRDRYNSCVGIRPIMRVLNGMMSYERFRSGWNKYLDSVRWAMQLSAAWYHPGFHAMAEWLYDRDEVVRTCPADETLGEYLVSRAGGEAIILKHLGKRYEGAVMFCDSVAECPGINELASCGS